MAATAVGAIIAALVAGGTSIYSGVLQNEALATAGEESRKLSEQARQDQLRRETLDRRFQQQQLGQQGALQQQQINLSESLGKAQLQQQKARDMAARQQERYQNALSIIGNNQALKTRMRGLLGGAR